MVSNVVAGLLGVWVLGGAELSPSYNFLVMSGGPAPENNEIALEKNALYFQRTLRVFGVDPSAASLYFANGEDGQRTVRYLDKDWKERFKAPEIPHLSGPLTRSSFQEWLERTLRDRSRQPVFLYFTGHGGLNHDNPDNNYLMLWGDRSLSVRSLSRALDRLEPAVPVVAVMSQCFAGSFANFIYRGGDPLEPVAAQARCGFFATVKERPSVGCTPEVDEADYRDYSSSFFSGLSGYSRMGRPVPSADYDKDGRVSFAEAHAFAKVDAETSDWPVSTSEVFLRRHASRDDEEDIAEQPLLELLRGARPEQRHVVESLSARLGVELEGSFADNDELLREAMEQEVQYAYVIRLWLEVVSLGMETRMRGRAAPGKLAALDRLQACERGSWHSRPAVEAFALEPAPLAPASLCVSAGEEGATPHRIASRTTLKAPGMSRSWTLRFAELFARGGMKLKDPLNLIHIREHSRQHSEEYHQAIFDRLQATLEGCGDQEDCGQVLRMALRRLATELCTPETELSRMVTW
ncbi:MAG TPA: AHH domain-containing protein [Myxococcaceae bacterium]|nr:AHH domain-containing protein [Myxococcaceae bacterium]